MLEITGLSVSYGQHRALDGVSLRVDKGEIVVILGANGAGKSSLLRAIGGTSEGTRMGEISLDGAPIAGLPAHDIVERGIALVPEGRGIFPDLTVQENLLLGAYPMRARLDEESNMERVVGLFPKLAERRRQAVRTMSGGEQQMVAIGRAMMSSPRILMLDEPSLGLSPLLCKELFQSLTEIRKAGLGILLVEQNAKQSLAIADRGYLLENAHIVGEGPAKGLLDDPAVQKAYLGGAGAQPAAASVPPMAARAREDGREAARSAAEQALSFISTGTERRRPRTDELVAGGIDALVRHAAAVSTERVSGAADSSARQPAWPPRSVKPYEGATGPLAAMLSEMERAAARARAPERPSSLSGQGLPGDSTRTPPPSLEPDDWRREPEIKIYRRSGGKLRRVKGD